MISSLIRAKVFGMVLDRLAAPMREQFNGVIELETGVLYKKIILTMRGMGSYTTWKVEGNSANVEYFTAMGGIMRITAESFNFHNNQQYITVMAKQILSIYVER
jgi:hypothetical protein